MIAGIFIIHDYTMNIKKNTEQIVFVSTVHPEQGRILRGEITYPCKLRGHYPYKQKTH